MSCKVCVINQQCDGVLFQSKYLVPAGRQIGQRLLLAAVNPSFPRGKPTVIVDLLRTLDIVREIVVQKV